MPQLLKHIKTTAFFLFKLKFNFIAYVAERFKYILNWHRIPITRYTFDSIVRRTDLYIFALVLLLSDTSDYIIKTIANSHFTTYLLFPARKKRSNERKKLQML